MTPQCLENSIAVEKSHTTIGIFRFDESTLLSRLAMFGQLVLAGKLYIIHFEFVDLMSVNQV